MIRQGLDFAYVMQLTFGQVWEREGMYGGSFAKILIYKKCLLNKTSFTNGTYVLLCGEHPR